MLFDRQAQSVVEYIVILLFYPLVDRILSTLAGTAVGGGF